MNKQFLFLFDAISGVEAANLESGNLHGTPEPTGTTAPAEPVAQQAEQLYDVKVNGQTFKVPISELTNGYSRQRDYTEKTMRLAQERENYTNQIAQYEEQLNKIDQFLRDPRVQTALQSLQAGITDPNQPPTAAQLFQLQQQESARQQQMLDHRMHQMQQELQVNALTAQYTGEIDSTIKQLLDKHPVLQDIDGIDQLLKRDVSQRDPASLQEAKGYFAEAANARAERIMSRFQQQQKEVAIQQGKLVKNGIETGGTAPAIPPEARKDRLGSPDFFKSVVDELVATSMQR